MQPKTNYMMTLPYAEPYKIKMTEAIRIELGERKARFLDGNKKALVAGMEAAR